MAKKTKRKVSAVGTAAPASEVMGVKEGPSPVSTYAAPRSFVRRGPAATEFNPDYSYVVSDLKRVGAFAGTFFVVLVILSFFLR